VDRIEISGKEIKRLEVLMRLADGVLSQREAGRVVLPADPLGRPASKAGKSRPASRGR